MYYSDLVVDFFQISKFWRKIVNIFSKYQNFEEKLIFFFSTFYESNNGVIGILASENMKNDSSIMFM